MHNIIEKQSNIVVHMIGSDDNKYRYVLTKTWDPKKRKGVMIGINPSKATEFKGDNTVTNAMNFFIDSGFGELSIINLFPYMCTDTKELKMRDKIYDSKNDEYIKEICKRADMILVAWGYAKDDYSEQKKHVIELIKSISNNVKCFQDAQGNKPQHLRIFSHSWKLVDF